MSEVKFKPGTFSLSELGPYGFWARRAIGATDEDVAAAEAGTLSPKRQEELTIANLKARDDLAEMPVPGVQDWMSQRRFCN